MAIKKQAKQMITCKKCYKTFTNLNYDVKPQMNIRKVNKIKNQIKSKNHQQTRKLKSPKLK